jgi:4-diphosphocytidyl-2-C-methyl-D-erythritol kinase
MGPEITFSVMLQFPNAKINLGLYITNRRSDGYHDLETVFFPVSHIQDALEIIPCKGTTNSLNMSGLAVDGDQKSNLVWKAYELLKQAFPDRVSDLDIYLHKAIPMGAGLGGGSADGAFALKMINELCNLQLSQTELEQYALTLGSDCPFFIRNTPQFATSRGEIMEPISLDLTAYRIKVICPGIHVSTREAFSQIKPKPVPFDLRKLTELSVASWKDHISNDFEAPVFKVHPQLKEKKETLYAEGAVYASMSGSGSALFGLFKK